MLLKIFCLVLGAWTLLGCETTRKDPLVPMLSIIMKTSFADGTKVTKAWTDDDYYYRKGVTEKGDCRLSRTPIVETGDDFVFMRINGVTESCSGTSCEHCAFKKGGGCECKNVLQGVCTHTITRNRDLMRLR